MSHKEAKSPAVSKLGKAVKNNNSRFSSGELPPNGTVTITYKTKQHVTKDGLPHQLSWWQLRMLK